MADTPVNLSRYRKTRKRADARQRADENAVKFGRTRAERDADDRANKTARSHLDNHQRAPGEPDDDDD